PSPSSLHDALPICIITGSDLVPGDVIIGLESSGIHSNGLTLARHVFFERAKLPIGHVFPELGTPLGEELLRPTLIYVPEILEIIGNIRNVKALINMTGDGLFILTSIASGVCFLILFMTGQRTLTVTSHYVGA